MARTPEQLLEQATRHAAHLERLKTQDVNDIRELFSEVIRDITDRLNGEDVTRWGRRRMENQLAALRQVIGESLADRLIPRLNQKILELAEYEAGFEARSLGEVVDFNFDLPSQSQLVEAVQGSPLSLSGPDGGDLLEPFIRNWADGVPRQVANAVRQGSVQGLTTPQVIRQIRDTTLQRADRNLETVVRTGLQHAAHQARESTWGANRDIIRGVRWVSTLDRRTSTICQSLDGQVYQRGQGPRPPIHPNCRSTTVAQLDERFDLLDDGATRRARDPETGTVGSVGSNTTYYGWLKRQPAKVQDSIVGPTRGKLLRDGGITADRFSELQLDRSFQPITLDKMRELEPAAFERANID